MNRQAELGISPAAGTGRAYLAVQFDDSEAVRLGDDGLPTEILLWRDGETPTTKGTFKLTDKARAAVLADWKGRFGDAPGGSFDYEHDAFNDKLPGYERVSAGGFGLIERDKDLWLAPCSYTERAAALILKKEMRSTSSAFDFDPKTGEFKKLWNVALTNYPATLRQPQLLASGLVVSPPGGPQPVRQILVQVPESFDAAPIEQALAALRSGQPRDAARLLSGLALRIDPAQLAAIPFAKYPLDESDAWDGAAAVKRVRAWATDGEEIDWKKYGKAFAYVGGEGDKLGDYKLPHHDVKDGELVTVWGGVKAAGNAIEGSRGGVDIPEADLPAVKKHLEKHYHEFDKRAPWEPAETKTTSQRLAATGATMDYENCYLRRAALGMAVEDLINTVQLMQKADGAEKQYLAEHAGYLSKHLAAMAEFCKALGMQPEIEIEMPQGQFSALPTEQRGVVEQAMKLGAFSLGRCVKALLDVKTDHEVAPTLLALKTQAAAAVQRAQSATAVATASVDTQRRVKIGELQKLGMSPAVAQVAEGRDPVTGKLSGMPAWTLEQLSLWEAQVKSGQAVLGALPAAVLAPAPAAAAPPEAGSPAAPTLSEPDIQMLCTMQGKTRAEVLASIAALPNLREVKE